MPTLRRYLSARFALNFAGALLVLFLVVLIVDMLLHVDEVFRENALGEGLILLLLRASSRYLPYLLPFATFAGAFLAVGLAARSLEMLAIKSAGISPLRALLPVFVGAGLIAAAAGLLAETLSVAATESLIRRGGTEGDDYYRHSGQIWYHAGRFIYNIRSPDAESEELAEVRVYERDENGRLLRLIEATRAERLEPGLWRFSDGTLRSFPHERPEEAPGFERFEQIELALAGDRAGRRLQGNLAAVPIWALARYEPRPAEAARIRTTLHQRLTAPLLVVLFALLAVPLGLRAERARNLALPAAQGVLILVAFLMLREYGSTFALRGALPAALVAWSSLALFTAFGLWQLARAER